MIKQPRPKLLLEQLKQRTAKPEGSQLFKQIRTVCLGSDDGGLLYGPYKQVIAIKSLNNYANNKPYVPHDFKEQVKIKYKATKAIAWKFLNGTPWQNYSVMHIRQH